jgi:hypothetical protein
MGGAGAVRLAVLHPDLFAAAASMGGGERKEVVDAAARTSARLKERDVGFLFINGDRDRPDAFAALSSVLSHAGVENRVIIHPDLDHRLGRYYELSYEALMSFLGRHLRP